MRILEVGCGAGDQARALAAAGYDVLAIDPEPPEGEIFRQATLEELEESATFDATVAGRVLHHVHDLEPAVAKIARLAALVVVQDFGWDLLDAPTAAWYEGQRRALAAAGRETGAPSSADWGAYHEDLHRFEELRSALDAVFEERLFVRIPLLYRYLNGVASARLEQSLIDAGAIRALGFRFVGVRR